MKGIAVFFALCFFPIHSQINFIINFLVIKNDFKLKWNNFFM